MISHVLDKLNSKRIILASGSPRRQELLRGLGLKFEVIVSTFPETLSKSSFPSPGAYARENALCKAREVRDRLTKQPTPDTSAIIVIGADTVVSIDGSIIEKPKDPSDAVAILAKLSGRSHSVFTGLAILDGAGAEHLATEETVVVFSEIDPAAIRAYVATGSPLDKAGAYGIQDGLAGSFVSRIEGDFFNVVGLPINRLCRELISTIH